MMDDQDEGARIGVWVVLGVVALLLFVLIGSLALRSLKAHAPAAAAVAATLAPAPASPATVPALGADEVLDVPLAGDIVGTVYFEPGMSELPDDVAQALSDAMAAVTADRDRKLMLSGFHDPSGDPTLNAELAKNRAKAVREALVARGVAPDRIVLRKPEKTSAEGPPAQARRVEIRLTALN
jgi:outer membrane protein OmpA-like peptidoglycan-associated protein